ncbi:MAG: hydroxymethylglutaryl-CoA reductase, degradative [Bacteroidota bacterium]
MKKERTISGFSKLNKRGKIKWIVETFFKDPDAVRRELISYWLKNEEQQKVLDGFSENTISNFPMPFSVAPNFVVNGTPYAIPMVIEESSVVAAASSAAKYWMSRGGFKTTLLGTTKIGQIHLSSHQDEVILRSFFEDVCDDLIQEMSPLTSNMEARGGGIKAVSLLAFDEEPHYYQIRMTFETCDSMGANFINTVLEAYAQAFTKAHQSRFGDASHLEVIMCILSNYTPECIVRAEVKCQIDELGSVAGLSAKKFAHRFAKAVRIAEIDPYRATTHNKGIFNGIDAVVLATGNDFRAIEACGHTYASRDGQYRSLSHCTINGNDFRFWMDIPLALGTVGGLTKLHPIAKRSLELLGSPSAPELMQIVAAVGLAQNFAAVRSLVTTGIQQGHMKMHLSNVLYQLKATEGEFKLAIEHFKDKIVSHSAVREFLEVLRAENSTF